MYIIASGDHHANVNDRWEEFLRVHDDMAAHVERKRPDVFLSGGDIYDTASTPSCRAGVADFVTRVAEVCPVVIAKGNHDRKRDLEILARLRTRHPVIVEEACGVHHVAGGAIAVVAWPELASVAEMLRRRGMDRALTSDALGDIVRDALRDVLRGLGAELRAHDGPRVLLIHGMFDGALTSTGQPLIGAQMNIGIDDLLLAHADIVIGAHIHKAQEWSVGGADILYTGSPFRTDFGEMEEKSFLEASVTRDQVTWRRIPTPATRMLHLDATFRRGEGLLVAGAAVDVAGAEVRLRYRLDAADRVAGKHAATEWKRGALAAGARLVKDEPELTPTMHARVPEIASAVTVSDKLRALWLHRGGVSPETSARLDARMSELDAAVGGCAGAAYRGGTLQLRRLAGEGIGPFNGRFDVDFTRLSGLVAITGENGAGKSTFAELYGAAQHRRTATRGSLVDLATTRTSWIEADILNGEHYAIRHTIDAVSGETTSTVSDEYGDSRLTEKSAGKRGFDAFARTRFPPKEAFYAGPFAAQQAAGFVDIAPGARVEILVRILGLEYLETLAKEARARAASAKSDLAVLVARIADEEARGGNAEAERTALARAEDDARAADASVDASRAALARATVAHADARAARQRAEDRKAARGVAHTRLVGIATHLAGVRVRRADGALLLARAEEIRDAALRLEAIAAEEGEARVARANAADAMRAAEASRQDHVRRIDDAYARAASARAIVYTQKLSLKARISALRAEREGAGGLRARLVKSKTVLADRPRIEDAVARLAEIDATIAAAKGAADRHEAGRMVALRRRDDADRSSADAQARIAGAIMRAERARARLQDRETVAAAISALPEARAAYEAAERGRIEAGTALDCVRGEAMASESDRVVALRRGHEVIGTQARTFDDARAIAHGAIFDDDERANAVAERPARESRALDELYLTGHKLANAREHVDGVERAAARAGEMVAAEHELRAAEQDMRTAAVEQDAAAIASRAAEAEAIAAETAWADAQACGHAAAKARACSSALAECAVELHAAEARVDELEPQIARSIADEDACVLQLDLLPADGGADARAADAEALALTDTARTLVETAEAARHAGLAARSTLDSLAVERARIATLAAEVTALEGARALDGELAAQVASAAADHARAVQDIEALPELPEPPAPAPIAALEEDERTCGVSARRAHDDVASMRDSVARAEATAVRMSNLRTERARSEEALADWTSLGRDLGKEGLQAIAIDAAGPELTALANDLLHSCHGPRFSVAVTTTMPTADGADVKEECNAIVYDGKTGREAEGRTFSGGERAIVNEALALALMMLGCRSSGMQSPSIFRDETSAPLDPDNARAYVAMLRRAASLLQSPHVVFITQSLELQALADSEIHIADGKIEVRS